MRLYFSLAALLVACGGTVDKAGAGEESAALTANLSPAPVLLGAAGNFTILAKSAVTNIPKSAVVGDVGISPNAQSGITGFGLVSFTGFALSPQVVGRVFAADQAAPTPSNLITAVHNMEAAYVDGVTRSNPNFLNLGSGNIGGKTLVPGLYKWTSGITIPANVTLAGGANDVWIFQTSGTLTQASATKVLLSGGALAKNVFWVVAGGATLGTTSHFEGVLLSKTAIALQTGASANSRLLAQTAVTLDQNSVKPPAGGVVTPPPPGGGGGDGGPPPPPPPPPACTDDDGHHRNDCDKEHE